MAKRRTVWADYDVQSYIIDCYAGYELIEGPSGITRPTRQFLWEEDGRVWIGNTAAFALHLADYFNFQPKPSDFVAINRVLLDAGERLYPEQPRSGGRSGRGAALQQPWRRRVD